MSGNSDSEINSIVHLIKAHYQKKNHLINQINSIRIKNSYFRSNQSFRIIIELLQRIKTIRQNYANTKKQILNSKHVASQNYNIDHKVTKILNDYNQISNFANKLDQSLAESYKISGNLKDLHKILTEKKKVLNNLSKKFQHQSSTQKILATKKSELATKLSEIQKLKQKIELTKEKNRELEFSKLKISTNSFKNIKNAKILASLSKSHLNLYSKQILKQQMTEVLTNAMEEYERYNHFLSLEKRKLERLKFKNRSEFSEVRKRRRFESLATSGTDSWSQRLTFEDNLLENMNNTEGDMPQIKDFCVKNLRIDCLEDCSSIDEMKTLTNSLRDASQKLKGRIEKISEKNRFVFN